MIHPFFLFCLTDIGNYNALILTRLNRLIIKKNMLQYHSGLFILSTVNMKIPRHFTVSVILTETLVSTGQLLYFLKTKI